MKKLFISIVFVFTVMAFGSSAYATSGACSYHGGVDCSAGSDSDGSVICNDGWTDSSVSYSSMSMCEDSGSKGLESWIYMAQDITKKDCIKWINENTDLYTGDNNSVTCQEGWAGLTTTCEQRAKQLEDSGLSEMYMANARLLFGDTEKAYLYKCEPYYEMSGLKLLLKANVFDDEVKAKAPAVESSCKEGYLYNSSLGICNSYTEYCQANFGQNSEDSGSTTQKLSCKCQKDFFWNSLDKCVSYEDLDIAFGDVSASHKNKAAIQNLKDDGILKGYPDGTFKPDNTLNRAELLKIVILAKYPDPSSDFDKQCFKDVKDGNWYTPYICFAKEKFIVSGLNDGTFKPNSNITYAEGLKIALETMDYSPQEETQPWYQSYIDKALEMQVGLDGLEYDHLLTRGEMAQLIENIRNYK